MSEPASRLPRRTWALVVALSALVVACWLFPKMWYTRASSDRPAAWLEEQTNAPGWQFRSLPLDKSAEAVLAADSLFYGEFTGTGGEMVRLFAAKRFVENPHEIGLFVHTPDRCWTEAGWKLEPVTPDLVETELHGMRVPVERRIFSTRGQRELVYFWGLVGGQPLPYRLDHNLSVGSRFHRENLAEKTGTGLRATDDRFWTRVWESFTSRRQLLGPKQFLRISTPVVADDLTEADARLQRALPALLKLTDWTKSSGSA